jgi:hypothetical protein
MSQNTIRLLIASLLTITATTASAITTTLTTNFTQTTTASPWFTSGVAGTPTSFTTSKDINSMPYVKSITFGPATLPTQAATTSSSTVKGGFSVTGNSTAAGNWTDGNGIPTGIVVKFNTSITFSVGADSPAGSLLTLSGTDFSNGLGITQTPDTAGALDPGESLDVSAVTISNVNFTGSVDGYTVSNGAVGNIGAYAIRSPGDGSVDGFRETTKIAGVYTSPADPSGKPNFGFGGASTTVTGDGLPGDGITAGHLAINNGFDPTNGDNGHTNQIFQTGAWTFKMLTGSMALKGIGYQYDVSYNISPVVAALAGDFNHNGIVDAADYVLWKNGDPAADSNGDSVIDQTDYNTWYSNFGNTNAGAGSGLGSAAVPEPATFGLMLIGLVAVCSRRNSR